MPRSTRDQWTMANYIRMLQTTGDVAFIDLPFGVRTRAKTLALQRLARLPPPPPPPPSSGAYLQLRSRRLAKPPISKRQKHGQQREAHNPSPCSDAAAKVRVGPMDYPIDAKESDDYRSNENCDSKGLGIEASFGENLLDVEGRERITKESTPSSFTRDPETVRSPGSTTGPTDSTETNRRVHNSTGRLIPIAHEMEEFFAKAEIELNRQFIDKYNFDPVNDKPLPGRFEWEKLDPLTEN